MIQKKRQERELRLNNWRKLGAKQAQNEVNLSKFLAFNRIYDTQLFVTFSNKINFMLCEERHQSLVDVWAQKGAY